MSKLSTSDLTTPPQEPALPPAPVPKLNPDFDAVCACTFGNYPWDDWERWALSQGLDPSVAGQARLLIREWFNHSWDEELRDVCGWSDDGGALLEFARSSPEMALGQWDILMRTDGLRGDVHPQTGQWTWAYLQADAQRLLSTLSR